MIRVVIDTNTFVSALLQPESLPAAVLMLALSGQVQLCVSQAVFAEYDEVIRRPRLQIDVGSSTLPVGTIECAQAAALKDWSGVHSGTVFSSQIRRANSWKGKV